MKLRRYLAVVVAVLLGSGLSVRSQETPLRCLRFPALSPDGRLIAFCYAGDIYTVPIEGGKAKLLVKHDATESNPRFSPDGKTLAFNSTRESSNADIYTIPVAGGEIKRLTYHTAADTLAEWSPDGKQILFTAQRDTRFAAVYAVEVESGRVRMLLEDDRTMSNPTQSPDGRTLVYQRGGAPWWRKGYRGSANAELWAYDFAGKKSRRLTTFDGNDAWPLWSRDGKSLFYVSDRPRQPSLWKMNADGTRARLCLEFADDDIQYPGISRDGRTLVYECDHRLWTLSTEEGARPVEVTVTLPDPMPIPPDKQEPVTAGASEFELSPDGKSIVFVVRNDLFLMPAEGGSVTRLTDSPARDFDVSWSPDGNALTFISTRDANADVYHLVVATKQLTRLTTAPEAESQPQFSPDGKWVSFVRGPVGARLMAVPAPGSGGAGGERTLARGPFISSYGWSPAGEWIAYSKADEVPNTNLWVASVSDGKEYDLTNQAGNHSFVSWSPDGKHLVMRSDRGTAAPAGPGGFGGNFQRTSRLHVIDLQPNAFRTLPGREPIDFEGIQDRARTFTSNGGESAVGAMPDRSSMVYIAGSELFSIPNGGGSGTKLATAGLGTQRITVAPGGQRFWLHSLGFGIRYVDKDKTSATSVPYSVSIATNPRAEQRELFDEGWRLLNNDFYDARLHGVDWNAVRARYRPLVEHCWTKGDLILLMQELVGELNASHLGVGGSAPGTPITGPQTGALGVGLDEGYTGPGVRIAHVMKNGPADRADARLFPGDVIVKVGDTAIIHIEQFHHAMLNRGETAVALTIAHRPGDEGVPLTFTPRNRTPYLDLLYEEWVETNRARIRELSGGRLGYIHIKEMNPAALARFQREIFGREGAKEGVVLDVRYNPGGRIHDELLALLRKPHVFEYMRGTPGHPQPRPIYLKPMVLLINQNSGSDAEIFPNGFRVYGNGKLIGVPTYGAVIGTTTAPLSDGTFFRLPRTGWVTPEGRNLENWGVPPDIFVESLPDDFRAGADRQLERAVAELRKSVESAAKAK